jgi:hypothetical protein
MKRFVADTAVELGAQLALLEMISLLLARKVQEKVVVRRKGLTGER